ncbi:MAG: cysteine desulfurase NifS [Candidatus Aenigmatarchaeota archaeon]
MKKEIYLDHAATTYVDPRVKKEMDKYFCEEFGNPGSMSSMGLAAKQAMNNARQSVSKILNCSPKEIIFTSSGTESINLAIKGVVKAMENKGKHIITSKIEHHAVLHTCEYLESEGFNVTYLDVDKYGLVNPKDVEDAIKNDTILISIMYANNEIGTIEPVADIARIAKKHDIYFHTDACQAGCYLDLNVKKLGVDMMTLNGGKIYGPKGMGMLYVKSGVNVQPIIHGGRQENGLRAGTENIPGIIGFAKALEIAQAERHSESKRLSILRDRMISSILKNISKSFLNGHPEKRLPNNVNITFLDVEGEAVLLYLNEHGIFASTGSACTSEELEPSHVIVATGLAYEAAHGSIRFTLGRRTKNQDIDYVLKVLPGVVSKLRDISPVELEEKDFRR